MSTKKYLDLDGLSHVWLLMGNKLGDKVDKAYKTGSQSEYKVLSDNNLTDTMVTAISNAVQDANYVHTDNNFTTTLKNKLTALDANAEENTIETVKVNGTALIPDANKSIDIAIPTDYASKDIYGDTAVNLGRRAGETVGSNSIALGNDVIAAGDYSHAGGSETNAGALGSHAEGIYSHTQGDYSHAEGFATVTSRHYSHAEGIKNIEDIGETLLHIVGNGYYDETEDDWIASNAYTLDEDGNGWFSGDVYVGSTSGKNKDSGSKKLATEDYVDANGGKIDVIQVNGVAQTITNKTVDISVPTNNNQLTNGAGYQTASEVQSAINTAIGGITSIDYQVVATLPATGVKGTIYLVSNSGTGTNIYDEYIWVNNAWEFIGTTAVDLSNYLQDSDVIALTNSEIDSVCV